MRRQKEQEQLRALIYADYTGLGYHAIGWDQPHGPIMFDLLREPDWIAEVEEISGRAMSERPDPETWRPFRICPIEAAS